jgi:alpha-L-fucosidase
MKTIRTFLLAFALLGSARALGETNNPNTDWLHEAKFGVFMHFLPADPAGLALVEQFDAQALAEQLAKAGAGYFVITLGQNSGFFISPNRTYERYTGYSPGERCAKRDLPVDLFKALRPKGMRLMLYLPCQAPNEDARAQRAFGLPEGKRDQPLDLVFAAKWAEVIREWSERYGDKVAGWWFDGAYGHIQFNEAIAAVYTRAAKSGNPRAIVTFNPGVNVVHYTQAEDYTAGELNEPFASLPTSRWLDGSQWHALTFLGSNWGRRDIRYTDQQWTQWLRAVIDRGGVVTLDMGPNYNPKAGRCGALNPEQLRQVQAIHTVLDKRNSNPPKPAGP